MNDSSDHKPSDVDQFLKWSTSGTCGNFGPSVQQWYESSQSNLLSRIQDSDFFTALPAALESFASTYNQTTNTNLFSLNRKPDITWNRKPYTSFCQKLYRHNCLENSSFPKPPSGGWVSLANSFEKINDIIRTTLVVAYADAPKFLASQIRKSAESAGMSSSVKDHAQEKGYYAYHVYIEAPVPIASMVTAGDYYECRVPVEIQITTELQGALREITHVMYEQERLSMGPADEWKSDFDSPRFRAAHMAHALRFIEANIIDLRSQIQTEQSTFRKTK